MLKLNTKLTPVPEALRTHQTDKLVEWIKQNTAKDLNITDPGGRNLLQLAAAKGFVKTVLWLLTAGFDVNLCKPMKSNKPLHSSQRTPLFHALDSSSGLIAQILLIFGADLNITLQQAQYAGRQDIVNQLRNLKINPLILNAVLLRGSLNYHATYKIKYLDSISAQIKNFNNPIQTDEVIFHEQESKVDLEENLDPVSTYKSKIHLNRLIEFAFSQKLTDVANALIQLTDMPIQIDNNNVSVYFWLAKCIDAAFSIEDITSDSHTLRSLQELKKAGEKQLFTHRLQYATPSQVNAYLSQPDREFADSKMTEKQRLILDAAIFGDKEVLQVLYEKTQQLSESESKNIQANNTDSKYNNSVINRSDWKLTDSISNNSNSKYNNSVTNRSDLKLTDSISNNSNSKYNNSGINRSDLEYADSISNSPDSKYPNSITNDSELTFTTEPNNPQNDFFVILDWMISKSNFVGFKSLVDVLGVEAVFRYALLNAKQELFIFMMFYSDCYTYDCVHRFPDLTQNIIQMTSPHDEYSGLIFRMIDHSIAGKAFDLRTSHEIAIQKICFKLGNMTEQEFLTAFNKCLYLPDDNNHVDLGKKLESFSEPMRKLASDRAKRLGLNLERFVPVHLHPFSIRVESHLDYLRGHFFSSIETKQSHSDKGYSTKIGANQIMLDFLTLKEKASLSCVSTHFNKLCTHKQSNAINSFLKALQNEINNKSCCDRRTTHLSRKGKLFVLFLFVSYSVFILSIIGLTKVPKNEEDKNATDEKIFTASFFGLMFSSLCLFLQLMPCLPENSSRSFNAVRLMYQGLFGGKERFDRATLSEFSDLLQIKYRQLINEYAVFPNFSLNENSSIAEIRREFNALTVQMKVEDEDKRLTAQRLTNKN